MMHKGATTFVIFSQGSLNPKKKKFGHKSFPEQCYLYSLHRTQKQNKTAKPNSIGKID